MRVSGSVLAIALGLLGLIVSSPAHGVESRDISLIENFPTNHKARYGETPQGSWAFLLKMPYWPGANTCSLNGSPATPCSWVIPTDVADGLLSKLEITQTDAFGATTTDSTTWTRSGPSQDSGLNPVAYCRLVTGPITRPLPWYAAQPVTVLWGLFNDRRSPIDLTGRNVFADASLNPADPNIYKAGTTRAFSFDGRSWQKYFAPLPQTPPVFAPGESAPFATTVTAPFSGASKDPEMQISRGGDTFFLDVPAAYASCFRVIPPSTIIDNGDGTYSATFGWVNLLGDPLLIPTNRSGAWGVVDLYGHATRRLGTLNTLRLPNGAYVDDAGQPTYFPASSLGTWTYTWKDDGSLYRAEDAGQDPVRPFEWIVGGTNSGFYVRRSLATHHTQAPTPITPFTHINPNTPTTTPPIPVAAPSRLNAGDGVTQSPTALSGGHPGADTTIAFSVRRAHPRSVVARPGQVVRVDYALRNTGASEAVAGRLCETVPRGTVVVAAPGRHKVSATRYCWSSHRMAAGAAIEGHLKVRFPSRLAGRTARISISITYDNAPRVSRTLTYRIPTGRVTAVTG